jgi:hypothetical protein
MNDTIVKTLTAAEYFMSRKNHMERYIEGEHKWYGATDSEVVFNARPWYLDAGVVLKPQSF